MKSIIQLSAITTLAVFALVGCDQNSTTGTSTVPATNAVTSDVNSMTSGTNAVSTNAVPVINTNLPASAK